MNDAIIAITVLFIVIISVSFLEPNTTFCFGGEGGR